MEFASNPPGRLGVEIEVQLIDWRNQNLCSAASRVLRALGGESERIKPEIFQSMLEVCTTPCATMAEVEADLRASLDLLFTACDQVGVEVVGAGTHPFAAQRERLVYPSPRYRMLLDRNQWIARRMAIFGLHVHVGVRDGDQAIALSNALSQYLAPLLALSASSPFLRGHDTGMASSRITVFESQPTAGSPPTFGSWQEFVRHVEILTRAQAIESLKDLWWDIRPNPYYGTVELRICDGGARPADTLALVAVIQALSVWLQERLAAGEHLPAPAPWRMRENKWRAARWGMDADLVVDDQGRNQPLREFLHQLFDCLSGHCEVLGSRLHLERARVLTDQGPSYVRQRQVHRQNRSLQAVVQALGQEFREDRDLLEY